MRFLFCVFVVALSLPRLSQSMEIRAAPPLTFLDCLMSLVRGLTPLEQTEFNRVVFATNKPPESGFSLARLSAAKREREVSQFLDSSYPEWRTKTDSLEVMKDNQKLYSARGLERFSWGDVALISKGLVVGRVDCEAQPLTLFLP